MSIGIYDDEQNRQQPVILDLKAYLYDKGDIHDIKDTLCYHTLYKQIIELSQSQHFNLIEEFSEAVCQLCFQYQCVRAVTLTIQKPEALPADAIAGVEINRTRS